MGLRLCSLRAQFSTDSLRLLAILFGGLIFAMEGLCVARVNDEIDSSRLVEFIGGLLLIHGTGAAIGTTLGGVVMGGGSQAVLQMDPRSPAEAEDDHSAEAPVQDIR